MTQAYSRLKRLLGERHITVPELQKRIKQCGMHVNLKSLCRLSREHQPLERLELRVAGAICQVCEVPLSELITLETPKGTLYRLAAAKQKRLDTLMTKNNAGQLTGGEREELRTLVREAEEMILANARILAGQRYQCMMGL
jgi:hypothetical protein